MRRHRQGHGVPVDHIFVGNGSDEVLAHAFQGLLNHEAPLLFPDISYSFYPVYCGLYGIRHEVVPLDEAMRIDITDYRRPCGGIIIPNPNAPTGIALGLGAIRTLLDDHPDAVVVVDEAYVDFGAETAIAWWRTTPTCWWCAPCPNPAHWLGCGWLRHWPAGPDRGPDPGQGQFQFLSAGPSGAGWCHCRHRGSGMACQNPREDHKLS